jgi:hypothetical protein
VKFPKALFGTQRSPVQIRAARLKIPGQGLRIPGRPTPRRDWRGDFAPAALLAFLPKKRSPMTSAAARSIDAGAEAYTASVVLGSAWPSRVCAVFTSIPSTTSVVGFSRRRSWKPAPAQPAVAGAGSHTRRRQFEYRNGPPSSSVKTSASVSSSVNRRARGGPTAWRR